MNTNIEHMTTGFSSTQLDALHSPMDASQIKHRQGAGGRQLAYIKGKTAIDQANAIFGFGQWGYKVLSRSLERSTDGDGRTTSEFYTADVELYVVGAAFPFPGDGVGIVVPPKNGSPAESHEKARKEAVTDALKRALRHYGSQFANDLYDEESYVDIGDGVLGKVKDVKPGRPQQPSKRIVEEKPAPVQIEQRKAAADNVKERLNVLYSKSLSLKLFFKGADTTESLKNFLMLLSEIIGEAVIAPNKLTDEQLSMIERYVESKDAA